MATNTPIAPPTDPVERERWLDAIVPLAEAAELRGDCSTEALIRAHKLGIIKLIRRTERLWGMRRRDALDIPADAVPAPLPAQTTPRPISAAGRHPRDIVEDLIRSGFLARLPGGLIVETEKIGRSGG
jgi:hypothetical protein